MNFSLPRGYANGIRICSVPTPPWGWKPPLVLQSPPARTEFPSPRSEKCIISRDFSLQAILIPNRRGIRNSELRIKSSNLKPQASSLIPSMVTIIANARTYPEEFFTQCLVIRIVVAENDKLRLTVCHLDIYSLPRPD